MSRHFMNLLRERWTEGKLVCVGLDSDHNHLPQAHSLASFDGEQRRLAFNKAIVDATTDLVCTYKLNTAFYESNGGEGLECLRATIKYIKESGPEVPIILDAKRADIGNTNEGYVQSAFEHLGADAITVHPYLGREALTPFLDRADKGVIVLARTSNPGAGEFQDCLIKDDPLYVHVARQVAAEWNRNGNCALVVGATYPEEGARVRQCAGDLPLLIPGIGAQGGDLEATVLAARDSNNVGMMINSSRGIIFASTGDDFADAARSATLEMHNQIQQVRVQP